MGLSQLLLYLSVTEYIKLLEIIVHIADTIILL